MKKGITLLECMIYLAGSAGIMLCVGYIFSPYFTFLSKVEKESRHMYELLYVLSHFERDMQGASINDALWKQRDAHCLVWQHEAVDYGWILENNCLVRYQGIYHQGRWGNIVKTPLAHGIDKVHFDWKVAKDGITGVWFYIQKGAVRLSKYVGFMEGRALRCS